MKIRFAILALAVSFALADGAMATGRLFPRLFSRPMRGRSTSITPASVYSFSSAFNLVNLVDRGLPIDWSVEDGKHRNIKWHVDLKSFWCGTPVVADGRVFVATISSPERTNGGFFPRKAILAAYRESDGKALWKIEHKYPHRYQSFLTDISGLVSNPAIDGQFLYYATPIGEVVCAEARTGIIRWRCDMAKCAGVAVLDGVVRFVYPQFPSPLVVGDRVYVNTGHGRDDDGKLMSPNAPSFMALDKGTGQVVWQSYLPGDKIIQGQWCSPTFAVVNGVPQVIFGGGDSVLYGFHHPTSKLLWKCDLLPDRKPADAKETNNQIIGSPVVVGNFLYIGIGVDRANVATPRYSYFLCLDISKCGDISLKSYDSKSDRNQNSALVWAFGGRINPPPTKGRRAYFGPTVSTPAIHDGLVYIPENYGYFHCLDAATGQRYWVHDARSELWSSPYWVDGRVYIANGDGVLQIFQHGKAMKLLGAIDMAEPDIPSVTVSNRVLFIATKSKLFAIHSQ